ncbi:MAG: hypothetical protein PHR78_03555 [Eubacteriales bacterium]|nr:hypothetical protein [Eubacteriales bacterium]MDD4323666.1 hypothetical protein [Eubacteriales bacterium]MDD4541223.1 hypothetical protein [Eubacteriales bacterium]
MRDSETNSTTGEKIRKYPTRTKFEDPELRQENLENVLRNAKFYPEELALDDITDSSDRVQLKMKWIVDEDLSEETVERVTLALEEMYFQSQLQVEHVQQAYFQFLDTLLLSDQDIKSGSAACAYGKLWLDLWLAERDSDAAFRASIYFFKAYLLGAITYEHLLEELEPEATQTIESILTQGFYQDCNTLIGLPEVHALSELIKHYPDAKLTAASDEKGEPMPLPAKESGHTDCSRGKDKDTFVRNALNRVRNIFSPK